MSSINSVGMNATVQSANTNERQVSNDMDKEAFLKILVSQLRNQDPMNPMEDKDFIAQMAQFSVLEQMQEMNAASTFGNAAALIGRTVTASVEADDGSEFMLKGVVKSVTRDNGEPSLEVDGYSIPYSKV